MKNLEEQNLKIRIQILDTNDNVLISGITNQQMVHDLNIYHGISGVDQTYHVLLDELVKNQQAEK
jgi:hypothetical protein